MRIKRNETFIILSAIGILLILLGHLDFPLLNMGGLFPYYSFHVMLFVFISGYFYKPEEEEHILAYLKRKAPHLLIPYFIWNVVYGILATLLHGTGMQIGENINLYNLFIAPFLSGHQFMYQAASWFVPALFLVELCNILGRKIL
ncbi:MAG: acyltransferase family protein, partial [Eubacterium sp.]|nr:acyltransferase family protein [Eubacterium sp.]